MKKIFSILLCVFVSLLIYASCARAFLYDAQVLDDKQIEKLSDHDLLKAYIDLVIELKASTTFSEASGFNKKDYDKFKELLHYQVNLMLEIEKRDLDLPDIRF